MITQTKITKTTKVHFTWTDEDIKAMMRDEVEQWLVDNFTIEDVEKASINIEYGSRYEGGIDANATVEIREDTETE